MKALDLLKANKTVEERAQAYVTSVKRNIKTDVIDALTKKKEKIEDELFELTNFTLDTNVNKGLNQMTKEDVETRFKKIIDLEYQLTLVDMEIKVKSASFDKYFGETAQVTTPNTTA